MTSIAQSLARQNAIINQSNAQMEAIRASQSLQDLAGSRGDMKALHQKELQLQLQKEQAELKAKVAREQKKALDKKKKLDTYA